MTMFRSITLLLMICSSLTSTINLRELCQSGIRDDGTTYVHCARKSLTEIPSFAANRFFNLAFDELILSDNSIEHIPWNAFNGLRIKRLIMSGNRLKSIDRQAFRELENYLEELIVEFDTTIVDRIPQAIENNLANVRSLTLVGLNLRRLPSHSFVQMKKLESLTLKSCSLEWIEPNAFVSLEQQLRHLYLDYNQLNNEIFPEIQRLIHLETLSLSHNLIEEFSMDYLNQDLRLFDMSYNQLKRLTLTNIDRLEIMNLQNNLLTSETIEGLWPSHLKQLILDFNSIHTLEKDHFSQVNGLEFLSIQGNEFLLNNIEVFQNLKQLKLVNLARNSIQSIPPGIFKVTTSLEDLILDRNPIESLTIETFSGLENTLKNFSCQSCSLLSDSLQALGRLHRLERLKLQSNQLKEIKPKTLFSLMPNLVLVDLQRNQLNEIPSLWPASLRELQLGNNQIKQFDAFDRTPSLKQLTTLDLSQNPLNCDCAMKSVYHWLLNHFQAELVPYVQWICATPTLVSGKKLGTLTENDFVCLEEQHVPKPINLINWFQAKFQEPETVFLQWSLLEPRSTIKLIVIENDHPLPIIYLNTTDDTFIFEKLKPSTNYTFCLQIDQQSSCDRVVGKKQQTLSLSSDKVETKPTTSLLIDAEYLIVLISLSIGLVLIILFILIVFLIKQRQFFSKTSSKATSIDSYYQTGSETTQIGFCSHLSEDRSSQILKYPSSPMFCTCHLPSSNGHEPSQANYHLYHEIPMYRTPMLI